MADAYATRVDSLREPVGVFDEEINQLDKRIHQRLKDDTGYRVIQQLNGVGRVPAALFITKIGDVPRYPTRTAPTSDRDGSLLSGGSFAQDDIIHVPTEEH
jgi:hypothetical protein